MEMGDVKDFFTGPNMTMVVGAVGGFALGTYIGKLIAGKLSLTGFQNAIVKLLVGLGTGAILYGIGKSMEPESAWKPAVYGLAIGATMPGIISLITELMSTSEKAQGLASLMFGAGAPANTRIKVETV